MFSAATEPPPNADAVVNKYTFYVDGAVYKTAVLVTGDTLNQPENPTKAYHRFAGWYADETLTTPFTDFGETITADGSETKIYAKFEPAVYYITFYNSATNGAVILTDEVIPGAAYAFSADYPAFDAGLASRNIAWPGRGGHPI